MPNSQQAAGGLTIELVAKEPLSTDILTCTFRVLQGATMWHAGQYIVVRLPSADGYVERTYSIASHPRHAPELTVIIKLLERGIASDFFRAMNSGDRLEVQGPKGNFVVGVVERPVLFMASGVGVAPVLPMLEDVLAVQRTTQPVQLLFYKTPRSHPELDAYFTAFEEAYPNFRMTPITDERSPSEALGKETLAALSDVYVCGGQQFVADMKSHLVRGGLHTGQIHHETPA